MDKIKLDIRDSIADTLFITLYAKAIESKKKNPLIQDDVACQLIEKVDYDFSKYKNKTATSVGVALRANHFDQMVKMFVQTHQQPIVVFIGCGLDSRIQRIGESAKHAQFYQLDIAEVIQLRQELLPITANEQLISGSILENEWMNKLQQTHPSGNFMFVIEGVLMYFTEQQNQLIFNELAQRFPHAEIHFDILNTWMSRNTALHDTVSKTKATFKSGIDFDDAIEHWHPKLKLSKSYLYSQFKGWRRMGLIFSLLMPLVPKFKTSSRILTYKILA